MYWETFTSTRICAFDIAYTYVKAYIQCSGFVQQSRTSVLPFYVWTTWADSAALLRSKEISATHLKKISFERNVFKGNVHSSHGRTSLAVQWLRPHASISGGTGSVLGWGTKIPHAAWHGQNSHGAPQSLLRYRLKWNTATLSVGSIAENTKAGGKSMKNLLLRPMLAEWLLLIRKTLGRGVCTVLS